MGGWQAAAAPWHEGNRRQGALTDQLCLPTQTLRLPCCACCARCPPCQVSFAADNNFGDVSAKATSQTICASVLGTSAGERTGMSQ